MPPTVRSVQWHISLAKLSLGEGRQREIKSLFYSYIYTYFLGEPAQGDGVQLETHWKISNYSCDGVFSRENIKAATARPSFSDFSSLCMQLQLSSNSLRHLPFWLQPYCHWKGYPIYLIQMMRTDSRVFILKSNECWIKYLKKWQKRKQGNIDNITRIVVNVVYRSLPHFWLFSSPCLLLEVKAFQQTSPPPPSMVY